MTKSRWANWSRGTEDKLGFGSFMKEAIDSGNPSGTGTVSPAERARQLGLQSDGSGGYTDESGNVVARTVNNELVFYDQRGATGGVVSDGEGGQQLATAQPSWSDPKTGMLTTPPAQPESPEELAAVPDATPSVAQERALLGISGFSPQSHVLVPSLCAPGACLPLRRARAH